MNIFCFRDRAGILDERPQRFLMTVAWLGWLVLQRPSGELAIAMVAHFGRPEPRVAQDTHRWHPIRHATVQTHGKPYRRLRRRDMCLRFKLTSLADSPFTGFECSVAVAHSAAAFITRNVKANRLAS